MNAWPKVCKMCRAVIHGGEWRDLPFVGYQDLGGIRLELRNCNGCVSTLAVEVEPTGLPWTLACDLAEVLRNDARELDGYPPPYAWPPVSRREPTDEAAAEARRLNEIADDLDARIRAWLAQEDAA